MTLKQRQDIMEQYNKGDKILHKFFGLGTVEAAGQNQVIVHFANRGSVRLDLNYAPIRKAVLKYEPFYTDYLNSARVLYVHHGHESHVLLEIGHICIPADMHQCVDLSPPAGKSDDSWSEIIGVNLTIYSALIGPYEAKEDDPLFGIHKPLWGNEGMIGQIEMSATVTVRRPDTMTMTPHSPIDWRGVEIKGFGRIIALREHGGPVIASCGVMFFADDERLDHSAISLAEGDLVTFQGYLVAFRDGW